YKTPLYMCKHDLQFRGKRIVGYLGRNEVLKILAV
nr:hypothetical protein [Tanacetum cinerariifolium]